MKVSDAMLTDREQFETRMATWEGSKFYTEHDIFNFADYEKRCAEVRAKREESRQSQVESYLETPDGKVFAEKWGVTDWRSYDAVLADVEIRDARAKGLEVADYVPPVDPDAWLTAALKRSGEIEAEMRATTMPAKYRAA